MPYRAPRRLLGGLVASTAMVLLAPFLGGCTNTISKDELQALFDEGEYLSLEARWTDARMILREYLLHDPDNPGAHFYLGRAYLFAQDFRPVIAEGELQMALRLFIEGGRTSPIERFGDDYFEMICNIESAKVCLLQIEFMRGIGIPPSATQPIFERAKGYVEAARAIMPAAEDVRMLEDLLTNAQQGTAARIKRNHPTNI